MNEVGQRSGLFGRRLQISGSANPKTDVRLIRYAHTVIAEVVRRVLAAGGGLVLGVGKEPLAESTEDNAPSILFDWTALETAADCLRKGLATWSVSFGPPLVVVTSEKSELEIPESRRPLWYELLSGGFVRLESIQAGARSGAMLRQRQAQFGDILLILGGGTGVEQLAEIYMDNHRPVIPSDLPLGASRSDGTGGSERLARKAREDTKRFFRLQASVAATANARLANIATRAGTVDPSLVVGNILELLRLLAPPYVFYTRLLNPKHEDYNRVENFFRKVVDPVVAKAGFGRIDMGTDPNEHGFINVAVFEDLHFASVVVADVTGARPNCYIELGYALGRAGRVIVTAKEGTELSFDQEAIPCHFWTHGTDDEARQAALTKFWENNVNRKPLVT